MTQRAVAAVAVDWQVEVAAGRRSAARLAAALGDARRARQPLPVGYAAPPASSAPRAAPSRPPGRASSSACPTTTRRVPRRDPRPSPARARARSSSSRPPPTCTPRRATPSHRPRRRRRPPGSRRPASSTCRQPTRCSRRSVRRRARSRQAPPDNVLLLPADRGTGCSTGWRRPPGRSSAARSTPGLDHHLPVDPPAAYTRRSPAGPATSRRGSRGRPSSATTSAGARPARAATRSTRNSCSSSSACPAPHWPGALAVTVASSADRAAPREGAVLRARGADSRRICRPGAGRSGRSSPSSAPRLGLARRRRDRDARLRHLPFAGTPARRPSWAVGAAAAAAVLAAIAYPAWHDARSTNVAVRAPLSRRGNAPAGTLGPRPVARSARSRVLVPRSRRLPARAGPRGRADHHRRLLGAPRPARWPGSAARS